MKRLSATLMALMYFAKRESGKLDDAVTWKDVRGALVHADYDQADHMKLSDVLDLVTKAYTEALSIPEFRMGSASLAEVLKAPFSGHFALEWPYWNMSLEKEYRLEQFYNSIFQQMISDLMFTAVSGCPQYIAYDERRTEEMLQKGGR